MAVLLGDALSEAHRRTQVRNAAEVALRVGRAFEGVDVERPGSGANFVEAMTPVVQQYNRNAANQARVYLGALQTLEAPGRPIDVEVADPLPVEQVQRSLGYTGPGSLSRRLAELRRNLDAEGRETPRTGEDRARARSLSTREVMGAAIRLTQEGARETTREYVRSDRRARGYVRVTAGDDSVCWFCAMLASRIGYADDSFEFSDSNFSGPGTAKVHDGCRCGMRPIYTSALPDETLEYQQFWRDFSGEAIDGTNRGAARNFRSQWEARQRAMSS